MPIRYNDKDGIETLLSGLTQGDESVLPHGGLTNQALIKNSNLEEDFKWADVSTLIGKGAPNDVATLDASGRVPRSQLTVEAEDIPFDNTISGLTATNVQDAIDEVVNTFGFEIVEGQERTVAPGSTWYSFGKPSKYSGDVSDWGNVINRDKIISVMPIQTRHDSGSVCEITGFFILNGVPCVYITNRATSTSYTISFKGKFVFLK